ncbi:MAG: putative M18 family aminopeptidase 1 [Pelotomaculum sp. PtaB.Bin013]|uniref:M18 family aminopeptidase n=1 Tax=Pelotomaculum isophthalicicum JI TaxID=947010 RepID=A0A9X4GYG7_9FIRM|nr:aminopeptidase [Pelotomaculum isophthalicicum]MDF9407762.1 aminopeptidase [Pelotomaculum isophthalicicum JI]OPX92046.1 MAG: putative M18 family aminopeptidase 1 [Pelotomaculum sp. PtaB.Bin013]
MTASKDQHPATKLAYRRQNGWDRLSEAEKVKVMAFTSDYKKFLNAAKTEREVIGEAIRHLNNIGFRPLDGMVELKAGDRIYAVNRHKALIAAVVGKRQLEYGLNVIGAHADSPRLDLKPLPVFEDGDMVFFKTHYYGGIKKYQWLSVPLALHGIIIKANGDAVQVLIGEKPGEPVFTIPDLLPHLAKDQMDKKMADAVPGENLNILVGGIPLPDSELKRRFKLAILDYMHREYNVIEEDLISAELELVPAWPAVDIGFDRSFVGGYGQDDRVCVYTALRALAETTVPERTALVLLSDKEEIGSNGNTGMESVFFTNTVREITARCVSNYNELTFRRVLVNSFALSADVNAGFDPNYGEVSEKMNTARLGAGVVLTKYTGSKGKYESNDAHAEVVALVRRLFNEAGVIWQTGELGKVDQGGGGTIAHLLAGHGMDVLDCGVALLGMHSPFEVTSKADVYMAYKGYKAFLSR